jgi:hypothetical protein
VADQTPHGPAYADVRPRKREHADVAGFRTRFETEARHADEGDDQGNGHQHGKGHQ